MRKTLAAVVALLTVTGCNAAVTAYNRDRTKSWMCVPNTQIQQVPLRGEQPLVITEPPASAARVAEAK